MADNRFVPRGVKVKEEGQADSSVIPAGTFSVGSAGSSFIGAQVITSTPNKK